MSQQEIDSVVSNIVMISIMGLWISWMVGIVVSMLTWSTCQCQHGQPHVTFHKILLQFSKGGCSGLSGDSTEGGGYSLTYNDSREDSHSFSVSSWVYFILYRIIGSDW